MRWFTLLALLVAMPVAADDYDLIINQAATRHGVEPAVLRAIVQKETGKKPWAFNCDGEGFFFDSKQDAVNALWAISKHSWMVKIRPAQGKTVRQFFSTQQSAHAFLNAYLASQRRAGIASISVRNDDSKSVERNEARVRQLWLVNTDIGIAQVNYRFHSSARNTVQQWFDPHFNLDYAASLVAKHKRDGRPDIEAAGDYHSKTPSVRAIYLSALRPIYEREKSRANLSVARN